MIRIRSGTRDGGKVESQLWYWSQQLHDLSGRNRLLYYRETRVSSATIEAPSFLDLFHLLVEQRRELRVPLPTLANAARLASSNTTAEIAEELEEMNPYTADEEDHKAAAIVNGEQMNADPKLEESPDPGLRTSNGPKQRVQDRARRHGSAGSIDGKLKKNEILTNHSVAQLNNVMYNLRYVARTVQEEQGFSILYVTFGMMKWRELHSSAFSLAPLVLVPVRLEREHPNTPYTIRMTEEDIVVNPVLQVKLLNDFGFQLPEVANDLSRPQLRQFLSEAAKRIKDLNGWEVSERATIGAFNFLTQLLIKDFEHNAALYAQHPLVRSLSGVEPVPLDVSEPIPEGEQLDDIVDPSSVFQVLDADSSQQEAIEAAKRGLSFVLQGPPGTGKSQTIANLIAESMVAGKRVLFVSQKMAALEVVQDRLRRKGLAEFCLEIHSHRMDKRKVIRDLMSSLSNSPVRLRNPDYALQRREIREVRDELNAYVRQLHEPRLALGLSLYELQGRLAQYLDEPLLDFTIQDIAGTTAPDLARMAALVREITGYEEIIRYYGESRWSGYQGIESSLETREQTRAVFRATSMALQALHADVCAVASMYHLPTPLSIRDDLEIGKILMYFRPEIFSASMYGAISRYKSRSLEGGRYLSLQYGEDARKLSATYRKSPPPTAAERAEIMAMLARLFSQRAREAAGAGTPVNLEREIHDIPEGVAAIEEGFAKAEELFGSGDMSERLQSMREGSPAAAAEWFADLADHAEELADWSNFNAVRRLALERGLGAFLQMALDRRIPPEQWEGAFFRRFYLLCIERVMRDSPLLQRFKGKTHTELIRRFRKLDLELIERTANEIKAHLYKRKPQWSWMKAESAETSVLRREFNKKRGLKPLRKLFREIPNLIQTLKPCLMMSPLTVCQLLDPSIHQFDLAVFDEASQIPPEYAVSAFLRAKQVVVAGDGQQLPPMNFFQTMEGEPKDDEEQDEARFESILTLCDSRGFPSKMLNWHYRSRDESLIAYSNYHFYDNRLYTFPSSRQDNPATGLKFVHVEDGMYRSGENARYNLNEARRVAELVYEHLRQTPQLSLGVVTFGVPQRRAIEAELERVRIKHPDLNALFGYDTAEPLFVKNLENVQGDERDVIILSIGYGRDETGKFALNFGPINRDGGTRRLNVAVTRARYLVYLVASIQPEDIDLNRATSQGARLLKNYLETARDGVRALFPDSGAAQDSEFETQFEESVFTELSKRGVLLARRVGVSPYRIDLAVKDPEASGRFLLGLECDGAMYRSGATARDRDRLRQQVLEGLGWRIYRIWSRDWIQNRNAEIQKILETIDSVRREPARSWPLSEKSGVKHTVAATATSIEIPATPAQSPNLPAGAVPYARAKLERPNATGMRAFLDAPLSDIIDALQTLANAEGPISVKIAKGLVAKNWETRQTKNVDQRFDLAVRRGAEQKAFILNGNFLWPVGRRVAPLRMHMAGKMHRKITDIAPEEVESAVRVCVSGAVTITREDLLREVAKLFGIKATPDAGHIIDSIIQSMIARKDLNLEGERIIEGRNFRRVAA